MSRNLPYRAAKPALLLNNSAGSGRYGLSQSERKQMNLVKPILLALSLTIPAGAMAKPSLRNVPEIENIIFAAALAHEISGKCASIKARKIKALGMAWQLKSRANDLGYSDAEIRAYVESDSEKARMRTKGRRFLKANGVVYGRPETFCAFGHAEISKSSAVGALLKAN